MRNMLEFFGSHPGQMAIMFAAIVRYRTGTRHQSQNDHNHSQGSRSLEIPCHDHLAPEQVAQGMIFSTM